MHHFLRKEYGTFRLFSEKLEDDPGTYYRANMYIKDALEEFPSTMMPLALLGVVCGYLLSIPCFANVISSCIKPCNNKSAATRPPNLRNVNVSKPLSCILTLILSYCIYILVFCHLSNLDLTNDLFLGVQRRFWMQPNIYLCFFFGIGIEIV